MNKYSAQAVTGINGNVVDFGIDESEGIDLQNLQSRALSTREDEVWDRWITFEIMQKKLLDLSDHAQFSLLACQLIRNGRDESTMVTCGRASGIRAIQVGDIEYREKKGLIYSRPLS